MLADLIERRERGIADMPDPAAGRQPLAPLVVEFGKVVGRKAGEKHTTFVVLNVNRVLAGCGFATVGDLLAPGVTQTVEAFVHDLIDGDDEADGMSAVNAATVGKHARQFTRWLWRKAGAIGHDPLAGVDLPSQATVGKRRALTPAELAALIDAADASPHVVRRLTGPNRAVLYLTAAATGLRAGELAALEPPHFHLDADPAMVILPGTLTKNGKDAVQPLPPAVVAKLRPLVAASVGRVWPGRWFRRAAGMFRADLAAAKIPVMVNGEEAVFHSLRHTYGTMLGRSAPIKVVQELARHSTPMLTIGRYGHTDMGEKAEAVGRLPLPGSTDSSPFAHMTRPELERYAAGVTATLSALSLVVLRVVPEMEPGGDSVGHAGMKQAGRGRTGKRNRG